MKVLVIGCGGVASVAISKCAQNAEVFSEICIASRTKSKCDALAEKMILLAKNEEMRKRFGKAAKVNCQQFSPQKVGEMWMALINKLTAIKGK